jgi:hypothetical protein
MQHCVAIRGATIPRVEENGNEMSRVQAAAERYRRSQAQTAADREELHAAIRAALTAGLPIGQVAREAGYDREHVRRIRDGLIG